MYLKLFYFFYIVVLLLSVVFVTLLERKVIGSLNVRVSPNWVIYVGVFQSVVDGLKLIGKKMVLIVFKSEVKKDFVMTVFIVVVLFLMIWVWYLWGGGLIFFGSGLYWMFFILSFFVYVFLLMGKGSGNKYVMLSLFRVGSQVISYEVNLFFLFIIFMMSYWSCYVVYENLSLDVKKMLILCIVFLFLLISEMGRVPFDFIESESELISGLNLEYGSVYFMIIFLVEYGKLIFVILLMGVLVCGFGFYMFLLSFMFMYMVVVLRGICPRFRYDKLMLLCWKDLFFVLSILMGIVVLLVFF